MTVTEAQKVELFHRLTDAIGAEAADTLIQQLPPVDWSEIATKADLAKLEGRLLAEIAALDARHTDIALKTVAKLDATNEKLAATNKSVALLQSDMVEGFASLDTKLTEGLSAASSETGSVENKMTEGFANAQTERTKIEPKMTEGFANVRNEMTEGFASVRAEISGIESKLTESLAEFRLVLAKHARWTIYGLVGFFLSFWVPVAIALIGFATSGG